MNNILKKFKLFSFVLSALLIISTITIGAPAANASTSDTVSLYYNDINWVYHGEYINNIYIKVRNIEYNKKVTIHYKSLANKDWSTKDAEFVNSLDNNYDIFKVSLNSTDVEKYYLTYKVNNQEFKDDNDGRYYSDEILGSAKVHALRGSAPSNSSYTVEALVRDSGDFKVVYTTDNWKTVKEQSLSYAYRNSHGFVYGASLDLGTDNFDGFKYAVCYTRDGISYWDNNFKNDFDSSYYNEY